MIKKITALFCITLIILTGTSNLLGGTAHMCKGAQQESKSHCSMPMEKMPCCPPEQPQDSCACPEMNNHPDIPAETSPAVFWNTSVNSGEFFVPVHSAFLVEPELQRQYAVLENFYSTSKHNKIYISIHSFLI